MRARITFAVMAAVILLAAGGAWRVHTAHARDAVEQFQARELHTADVIGSTLQSELSGTASMLRVVAAGVGGRSNGAEVSHLLAAAMRCTDPPCLAALTDIGSDGATISSAGRPIGLDRAGLNLALDWARQPANVTRVRTFISSSQGPAIVFVAPVVRPPLGRTDTALFAGIIAGEVDFDSIFVHHYPLIDGPSAEFATLVLDPAGDVVFRSNHPEMRLRNVFHRTAFCSSCHQSLEHVERMVAMTRGPLTYQVRGVRRLGAVTPFPFEGERGLAAVSAPADRAVVLLSSEVRQLGLLMLAVIVALGFTAQMAWRDSSRRLHAEAAAARKAELEKSHTELTALNAKLESAAVEWRTTVDTIDASLMVLDPSGRVERMNRAASDTLPGAPFSSLGQPAERLKQHPPWDAALKLAREAIDQEVTSTARVHYPVTGKTWDLWCRTPQGTGRRHSAVVVARDVTSLVELQESVRRSETMAALGLVVVGVAHEVRNPLFTISSLVDAWSVQTERDPGPLISALRREVFRLKTLMTELLEYGKATTTVLQPHTLGTVIADAIGACAAEADAHNVRIGAPSPVDLDVWIDPKRLIRVFINVIQNAVQHAPEGSQVDVGVHVYAERHPQRVVITVRDHGPGFALEDLPRVFTPFFTRRAGGFGLGLAITERIVGEHRGKIVADNHPDGGALVSISLPLSAPERPTRILAGEDTRVEESNTAGRR
jgi:signal transduction histidine kinase